MGPLTQSRSAVRQDLVASKEDKLDALGSVDFEAAEDFKDARPARGLQNDGAVESYRETRDIDCLHAIVYEDGTVKVHIDRYNPNKYPLLHLIFDATEEFVLFGTLAIGVAIEHANN